MDNSFVIEIVGYVYAANVALKAMADFAHFVATKTKTTTDDKIVHGASIALSWLGKLIDFMTANTRPKASA